MSWHQLSSKYPGTCVNCKERFNSGTVIFWDDQSRKTRHEHCPTNHNRYTNRKNVFEKTKAVETTNEMTSLIAKIKEELRKNNEKRSETLKLNIIPRNPVNPWASNPIQYQNNLETDGPTEEQPETANPIQAWYWKHNERLCCECRDKISSNSDENDLFDIKMLCYSCENYVNSEIIRSKVSNFPDPTLNQKQYRKIEE